MLLTFALQRTQHSIHIHALHGFHDGGVDVFVMLGMEEGKGSKAKRRDSEFKIDLIWFVRESGC